MGNIIWITGAGSGIGKALALAYNKDNNTIILSGRKESQLNEVAAILKSSYVLPLDVTDELIIQNAVKQVDSKFGKVDVLINNIFYFIKLFFKNYLLVAVQIFC